MKPKILIRIQHTSTRPRFFNQLLESFYIPSDRDYQVVWDDTSCWSGCQKCLTNIGDSFTHVLVLQDDVIVCADFLKTVEKIAELLPDKPISFFSKDNVIERARMENKNWATTRCWFMAQGYMFPVPLATKMVKWIKKYADLEHCNIDDELMSMYLFAHDIPVYLTAPSLVEHLGFSVTSLNRKLGAHYFEPNRRVAKWFIGLEKSGLDVDWSKDIDKPCVDDNGDWGMYCNRYIGEYKDGKPMA